MEGPSRKDLSPRATFFIYHIKFGLIIILLFVLFVIRLILNWFKPLLFHLDVDFSNVGIDSGLL